MAKEALNFRDFLTSLTSVPIRIKNKELAEIFQVSDGMISKIRHGKMLSIPISMRPLSNADRFSAMVMDRFAATVSTVEIFVVYASTLIEQYSVSDQLKKKIEAITWFDATKENHMEHVEHMCKNEIPAFLSSCYSEAYYNTSNAPKGEPARGKHGAVKQETPNRVEEDMTNEQRQELFWKTGNRLFGGTEASTMENKALFPLFYKLIYQEVQLPYLDFSRRKEEITITDAGASVGVRRQVDLLEQLTLPRSEPVPFVFQERLPVISQQPEEELIRSAIGHFIYRINDVPIQEYIFEHERIRAGDIYELFRVNRVEGADGGETYLLIELPFYLYPEENRKFVRLEARYHLQIEPVRLDRLRLNYKLKCACRFLEHEFTIREDCAKRFGIGLDIIAPFLYDTNAQFESPMSEKRAYTNGSKDNAHGRITFYDWALPGSGYSANLYRLDACGGDLR